MAATLLVSIAGPAAAAPVAEDGRIYACYKVKGKPKGAMRVITKAKKRCRRGERKVVWSAVSANGAEGAAGRQGQPGAQGSTGSDETTLQAKIDSLTLRVEGLEDSLALVDELCDQTAVLTSQANALEGVIEGLGLNSVLDLLGGLIEVPTLPGALDPFACPSP
ncbi:MAG TPA: hypothetical protein VNP96_01175 [Solirubrobacterales bacterium]|nr:hypothetical protein [Solirubrobacterales bacterium]